MLELKVTDPHILEEVTLVFGANGYDVTTHIQWAGKMGGKVSHYIVEVSGVTPDAQWLPIVPRRTRQAIENLGRDRYD